MIIAAGSIVLACVSAIGELAHFLT
jgi:hypothetical protein